MCKSARVCWCQFRCWASLMRSVSGHASVYFNTQENTLYLYQTLDWVLRSSHLRSHSYGLQCVLQILSSIWIIAESKWHCADDKEALSKNIQHGIHMAILEGRIKSHGWLLHTAKLISTDQSKGQYINIATNLIKTPGQTSPVRYEVSEQALSSLMEYTVEHPTDPNLVASCYHLSWKVVERVRVAGWKISGNYSDMNETNIRNLGGKLVMSKNEQLTDVNGKCGHTESCIEEPIIFYLSSVEGV